VLPKSVSLLLLTITSSINHLKKIIKKKIISSNMCESTAAEAVDDMQRMNVADRKKASNG